MEIQAAHSVLSFQTLLRRLNFPGVGIVMGEYSALTWVGVGNRMAATTRVKTK